MKTCVFPGSFDPITTGHVDLVKRVLPIFDQVIVAIGVNSQKKYLFELEQRVEWLGAVFADEPKVKIDTFEKLTADYCRNIDANWILRGLRNASDFDYEKTISQLNFIIGDDLETLFLISQPQFSHISSTIVREIIKAKGDASPFLPPQIQIHLTQ
jgi:pantetheine-phosphate adenylyltransferase